MSDDGRQDFAPAIDLWNPARQPECYAIQYRVQVERALLTVLRTVELEHIVLTFLSRAGIVRHWLPGYLFVKFDPVHDRWQQIQRAPGVVHILGEPTPIPTQVYHDLVVRCPYNLPDDQTSIVPVGAEVEIIEGALAGKHGIVSASRGTSVWLEMVLFNQLARVELRSRQVMIL
jgi:transcription antitermination factor NusG